MCDHASAFVYVCMVFMKKKTQIAHKSKNQFGIYCPYFIFKSLK